MLFYDLRTDSSQHKHTILLFSNNYSAEARPGRMTSRPGDQSIQLTPMVELEFPVGKTPYEPKPKALNSHPLPFWGRVL